MSTTRQRRDAEAVEVAAFLTRRARVRLRTLTLTAFAAVTTYALGEWSTQEGNAVAASRPPGSALNHVGTLGHGLAAATLVAAIALIVAGGRLIAARRGPVALVAGIGGIVGAAFLVYATILYLVVGL
ncbi:MAG: hypothetical protein FWC46_01300 [Actinomycetia bacterium]|nr:hypothetical protein [Actinomycetes bacterium]